MPDTPKIPTPRQYAWGGSDIAQLVALDLGWTVVDTEFVDEVGRLAGVPAADVAKQEERAPGLLERLARTLASASPEMFIAATGAPQVQAEEAAIHKMTARVIAEAAAQGRGAPVGRRGRT